MTKHIILFLAANPKGTDRRALDREAHAIRAELKRSGYRERFQFETWWAAEPQDLLRGLRELKPAVVHFSGHGGESGLFFQNANGDAQLVSLAAIAETLGAAGSSVKLIVLSSCYSEAAAEALLAHVDCVVGMGGADHNDAARSFAIGFYGALGDYESVTVAYRQGSAAIHLEGLSDVEHPRLKVRDGVDAAKLVLADVPAALRSHSHDADDNSAEAEANADSEATPYSIPLTTSASRLRMELPQKEESADRTRPNDRLYLMRWFIIGLGASCLLSGGVMAIASVVPAKGILGQLGLGVLLITMALVFDRIPHKEVAGTLRWITGAIVVLVLGLAYASVTGIYEAIISDPVSRTDARSPAPQAGEIERRNPEERRGSTGKRDVLGGPPAKSSRAAYVKIGRMSIDAGSPDDNAELGAIMTRAAASAIEKSKERILPMWGGDSPSAEMLADKNIQGFSIEGTAEVKIVKLRSPIVLCSVNLKLRDYSGQHLHGDTAVARPTAIIASALRDYSGQHLHGDEVGKAEVKVEVTDISIARAQMECVTMVVEDLIARKLVSKIKTIARMPWNLEPAGAGP